MADWPKKLSREALREVISQIVWSYWPYWGAPIVSATLFYMNGYPSGIIFMAALGAFALVALALNNMSQWLAAQSAAGKVDYLSPVLGVMNDETREPATLRGLKLGVALRSTALFQMEIRIDELMTQIADRVPAEAFYARSVTAGRGIVATFSNALIDVSNLERANQVIHGKISASVSYGRPGKLRHTAERTWYMAFKFDKDGNLLAAEPSLTAFTKENGPNLTGFPEHRRLPAPQ